MSEQPKNSSQSLSEISHLFLSGMRERQNAGAAPRPTRKPPLSMMSVDLAPEEFEHKQSLDERPSLSAVLGHHLGGAAVARVRDYARYSALASGRVGLIELGDDGIRLTYFDASPLGKRDSEGKATPIDVPASVSPLDGKRIAEALEEMSWDIERWIVFLPGGAKSEIARHLLETIDHWTILTSADDEGIVSAYRALKGIGDSGSATLTMSVFNADDESHGAQAHRKLAGASKQFLGKHIDFEGRVTATENVSEHVVLWCRASGPTQDHWNAVMNLAQETDAQVEVEVNREAEHKKPADGNPQAFPECQSPLAADPVAKEPVISIPQQEEPQMKITPETIAPSISRDNIQDEVFDLAAGSDEAESIVATILRNESQWIAAPVKAPMHESATVAVDRDGRLLLAAAAGSGLADLPLVSKAFAWLTENRSLVRLAMPQMNIDARTLPRLVLAVDQLDATGGKLATLLQGADVTVRTYRRLRWGEKTGLLLEAA
jgi:hypothetical protein